MQLAEFCTGARMRGGISKAVLPGSDTSLCSGAFSAVGSFIGRLVNFGAATTLVPGSPM